MSTSSDTTSDVQANLDAYWSGRAPEYDAYQQRPERLALDRAAWGEVLTGALPAAPAKVLDVGSGSGYVAFLLASLGYDVTATDLAEGMLEVARARAAELSAQGERVPEVLRADAVAPDFAPGSFDAITNRYVLWTLREPDTALANWRRLLKPGGVLVAIDSNWFPEGLAADTTEDFQAKYDDAVRAALPLAEARSMDPIVERVRAAGFSEVTLTPLQRILELDREYGVAPNHEVQVQYLIRAVV